MDLIINQDNPNPNAKVGFVVCYPFHFFVYKNIYKHIDKEAEFIVDLGVFFPNKQPDNLVCEIVELLKKNNVFFRILKYEEYFFKKNTQIFISKYSVLVGVWMQGCLKLDIADGPKKVHVTYGAGKELTTFGLWKKDFDLILAYGDFDHKIYSLITSSVIVGNPKFDDWFSFNFDRELLKNLKLRLDHNKKTILYLPTHGDLSSIAELSDELKKISQHYNILIKVHYFSLREETDLIEKIKNENIFLFEDNTDLITLLKEADLVLSDNSSVIFDAILANKKILVTDFHSDEYLNNAHKYNKMYNYGFLGALTYSGSIEQRVKKNGTVHVLKNPKDLKKMIEIALIDNLEIENKRKALSDQLFGFYDASSGERASNVILKLVKNELKLEKPLLYHSINNHEFKILSRPEDYSYFSLEGAITVVILDTEDVSFEDKIFSLHSIFLSINNFKKTRVDVFIITKNKEWFCKYLSSVTTLIPTYLIFELTEMKPIGVSFKKIIEISTGDFIYLTTMSSVVPENWLENFRLLYAKNNDISGVGGHTEKQSRRSVYDEYKYFLIGNSLRLSISQKGYMKNLYEIRNSLPFQNPFGSIKNSSYRKSILKNSSINWERINNLETLEVFLRLSVFKSGKVIFHPVPVFDLERLNYSNFKKINFNYGIAYRVAVTIYPEFFTFYKNPIQNGFKNIFTNVLSGYWRFRLTFIIFIATIFYSIGYYYITLLFLILSLKEKDKNNV